MKNNALFACYFFLGALTALFEVHLGVDFLTVVASCALYALMVWRLNR